MKQILSIVVPVYFNEATLPTTIPALLDLREHLSPLELELVFVDDGSEDRSHEILLESQKSHPEVIRVVQLSRNFGAIGAVQAGLAISSGDCVGVISADLQDPPTIFLDMAKQWQDGKKAVFGVRTDRSDPFFTTLFASVYYGLLRRLVLQDYPEKGFDVFLLDREIITHLNSMDEKNTQLQLLIRWLGYRAGEVHYSRSQRKAGTSRWTFQKRVKLFLDTFIGFSYTPIRLMSFIGVSVAVISFAWGLYLLFYSLFYGIEVAGFASIMVGMMFLCGLQMTMLGVLGEYTWRVLDEVRHRPNYVIDQINGTSLREALDSHNIEV